MYQRVSVTRLVVMAMYKYIANRQLALRTIIFLFGVTAVTMMAPRPVFGDIIIIRTNGNGLLTPPAPATFVGNKAQFQKTLSDLKNFDIDILVTGIPLMGNTTITLEEMVFNNTNMRWQDYHFTLGSGGFGLQPFVASTLGDFLFFVPNGATNMGGNFVNPPTLDDPLTPNNLSWFAGTGVAPGVSTRFSVAITIGDNFDGTRDGSARFTLRQRATVPEPTTLLLLSTGLAAVAMKMRKKLKSRTSDEGTQ